MTWKEIGIAASLLAVCWFDIQFLLAAHAFRRKVNKPLGQGERMLLEMRPREK